jgi:undecaprenyl-diphosphatase
MTFFQSIILGIVQGITEFIPISSSGHLVAVPFLFGWELTDDDQFIFNVLVQVASILAVIIYFWKDLTQILTGFLKGLVTRKPLESLNARLGWYLILATIPAGIVGLVVRDTVEAAFLSPTATAIALLATAILLVTGELVGRRNRGLEKITWLDALMMGLFQILALFPGVSRSGSTITGGMLRNLERPTAARFSFLMAVPIMLAAGLLALIELLAVPNLFEILPTFLAGFAASAVAGYISIHWLLRFLARSPMYIFSGYLISISIIIFLTTLIRN